MPRLTTRALALTPLLLAASASAQSGRVTRAENNAWLVNNSDLWITPTWGVQTEELYERTDLGAKPMVVELRAGAQHLLRSGARLAAGGTFVHTSPYGPFPARVGFNEYRTWEQATVDQRLGVVSLTHRYRLEERWIMRPVPRTGGVAGFDTDPTYTLRMRYQLRGSVPITRPTAPHSLYALAADEAFIGLGPHTPNNVFDQNRAIAGLGLRWSAALRTELSYLDQVVLHGNGTQIENNHTVFLNIVATRVVSKR